MRKVLYKSWPCLFLRPLFNNFYKIAHNFGIMPKKKRISIEIVLKSNLLISNIFS